MNFILTKKPNDVRIILLIFLVLYNFINRQNNIKSYGQTEYNIEIN